MAGSARGRRLDVPPATTTRPTSDRVREALFNALESLSAIDGAKVLDAFAGSGALGIEALSRGADQAVFADTSPAARQMIEANLAATQLAPRASVVGGTALSALRAHGPFDLVLLDPPYGYDDWPALLEVVGKGLNPDAVVVIESDREVAVPDDMRVIRNKQYGSTVVLFAVPFGDRS